MGAHTANPLPRPAPICISRHRGFQKDRRLLLLRKLSTRASDHSTADCLCGSSRNSTHISGGLFLLCRFFVYCWNFWGSVAESPHSPFATMVSPAIWLKLPSFPSRPLP